MLENFDLGGGLPNIKHNIKYKNQSLSDKALNLIYLVV